MEPPNNPPSFPKVVMGGHFRELHFLDHLGGLITSIATKTAIVTMSTTGITSTSIASMCLYTVTIILTSILTASTTITVTLIITVLPSQRAVRSAENKV